MKLDLTFMKIPLPEDIEKLKAYGDYDGANKAIDFFMTKNIPASLKKRLEIEKEVIKILNVNEYPYDYQEALQIMKHNLEGFKDEELAYLKDIGAADWIYINGQVHFQKRFYETLVKTRPEFAKRVKETNSETASSEKNKEMLNNNISYMKKNGGRTVRTRIKASIKAKEEFEEAGRKVCVHIPIPKKCKQISNVNIISTSMEPKFIAPEDAPQRTVFFETELQKGQDFYVEYEYDYHIDYVELDPKKAECVQPEFCLEEEQPHIVFTPYLKEIVKEIIGDEKNPVIKARKIYDFVTTRVMYSYMREYFTIPCISEYAALNLKGDCGVQAILFITLCRIAGIPARWQSGLYATPNSVGCHDWAQFYIEPYGWCFADPSFGGSAYRCGDTERWNYYFGNLDIYRMVANSEFMREFIPAKNQLRMDPTDNQVGEFEYEDHGLLRSQIDCKQELISMKDM